MTNEEIKAQIDEIRAARGAKGGRMSNDEKARIAALEAMLTTEGQETMSDTTEAPEQAPEAPTAAPEPLMDDPNNPTPEDHGHYRVVCDNVCIPAGGDDNELTRLVRQGEVVAIPRDFAGEHPDKFEAV